MDQMFDIFGHKKWKIPKLGGGGGEGFANVGQNPVFFLQCPSHFQILPTIYLFTYFSSHITLIFFIFNPLSMFSEQINNCADRGSPCKWLVDLWIVTQSKDVKCQCEIAPPWPLLWFYCQCQVVCHSTICKLINF